MHAFRKIALTAALTVLTAPAWAALTYVAQGSYNLGSASSVGGTAVAPTDCAMAGPATSTSQDVLKFAGSGDNNIGIHAYSCNDAGSTNFGSRASGENTFFAQGLASVTGTLAPGESDLFSFYINPGEVGAFGSTAFGGSEFQKAKLTIKLVIDNIVYLDEAWSAEVGAGGTITATYDSLGSDSVDTIFTDGAGYVSYGVLGGYYSYALSAGPHNISYVMTSEASGNSVSGICTAVLYGEKRGDGGEVAALNAEGPQGPQAGEAFTSYCGAGARTGDPFGGPFDNDPIARAQAVELPEPMTAGLTLVALLAAAGARRRSKR